MSMLYLVRHGQASFLLQDYDQLSSLGVRQSQRLAEHWLRNKIEIDEAYAGTLIRQQQTAEHVGEVFNAARKPWPEVQLLPGLNEYAADDFFEILRAELAEEHETVRRLSEEFRRATEERERYRTFHRLLESVMTFYISGDYSSDGFETWRQFHDRVTSALRKICFREGRGRRVAVFTSGGPIGVAVQTALQAPEQQAGALNWRIYNASITTFVFTSDRISLDQFNAIPHLVTGELLTYR